MDGASRALAAKAALPSSEQGEEDLEQECPRGEKTSEWTTNGHAKTREK